MKCFLALVVAWFGLAGGLAHAQSADDQYIFIFTSIQQADALLESGQPGPAVAQYREAQTALVRLQTVYPNWNPKIVKFRLSYITAKLATATAKLPATPTPAAPVVTKPVPAQPAAPNPELLNELKALREQVGQLEADKNLLEAKLKEALTALPAALDPRELARAEERIRALEKETDLLKVTLEQERVKKPAVPDTAALDRLKQELAESKRQVTEQSDLAKSLAQEKAEIQKRLEALSAAPSDTTELTQTRQALAEANRRLAEETEANRKLAQEKQALQTRVQTLGAEAEALAALRAENELLKKQAADLKTPAGQSDADRELQKARAQIAALQSDMALVRAEKAALAKPPQAPATPSPVTSVADAERIRALESERDALQTKLDGALRELVRSQSPTATVRAQETAGQLAALRARLEILEARPVPYSAEELALMTKPAPRLATPPPAADATSKPSAQPSPASTALLVAEAQRQFAARQYDQAEQSYLQVLRQDDHNAMSHANLAVIQMELNKLGDAEAHARQAVAVAPDDAYSYSVLGQVEMRWGKYDGALDALSRAAELNPRSAEVQNYLGITLSHKGLRVPAETALRKAIQLEPGYGSAHNNLAVIYLNQTPPMVELARWHYKKALAAGQPKNPELEKALEAKQTPASAQ